MSAHEHERDRAPMVSAHRLRALGLVILGGAVGAAARYLITEALLDFSPWVTLVINIVGAFLLGCLLEGLARRGPDVGRRRSLRLLLGTGVLGGFTTYSSLAVDTDLLLRQGMFGAALAYAGGTVLLGMLASVAGIVVAGHYSGGRSDDAEESGR